MIFMSKKTSFIDSLSSINVAESDINIIDNTKNYREKLFELISSAKKRIFITALYLQDDEAGKEVLTAIYKAKQANPKLEVKIFVDFLRSQRGLMGFPESVGNVRLYREMNDQYEHKIQIFGVPVKTKELLGVLHLKGFVFDDTLLYSGSSINNIYLQQAERYRYDRYHLIVSSVLADSFVHFLLDNFVKSDAVKVLTGNIIPKVKKIKAAIKRLKLGLRKSNYFFKEDNSTENKNLNSIKVTPLLGFGGRNNQLNKTIHQLIKQTEKELVIFTPYFNFPGKVHKAVKKSLKQGKKITIIVGDKTANDFFIPENEVFNKIGILPYIYETSLRRFVKSNQAYIDANLLDVFLWVHEGNSFHLKGINSDQSNYLITGHNINPRAWSLDIENGVLIQDRLQQLKTKFTDELKTIMKHCTRINHFEEIETIIDYRPEASKLLKSVKRAKLDSILNRLL
jgi:CDP-diacylglycerol--serine O-phosphatidyltransferase